MRVRKAKQHKQTCTNRTPLRNICNIVKIKMSKQKTQQNHILFITQATAHKSSKVPAHMLLSRSE